MTVQAVSVYAVHFVTEVTRRRFVAELPASVRVPVIVWFALNVIQSVFVAVPVRVNVANVLAQVTF